MEPGVGGGPGRWQCPRGHGASQDAAHKLLGAPLRCRSGDVTKKKKIKKESMGKFGYGLKKKGGGDYKGSGLCWSQQPSKARAQECSGVTAAALVWVAQPLPQHL